jgi:hypothetical protein
MKNLILIWVIGACAFLFVINISAQEFVMQQPPKEVIVKADDKTKEEFDNLVLHFILSPQKSSYEREITSKSGKTFKVIVRHNLYDLPLENWAVELYEVNYDKDKKENDLGINLLRGPQVEPKERYVRGDLAGMFYPEEKTFAYTSEGKPLYGNGIGFYFFKTVRKIKFENFCVILKAGDYKFNESDKNKLDLFEIFMEISPNCKSTQCEKRN